MADLSIQEITRAGLKPAFVAAEAAGDKFINNGKSYAEVINGGAGAINVTVDSIAPCDQGFDHNEVINIPATEQRKIGPFGKPRFNDTVAKIALTYDDVTSVTIGAFSL